MTTNSTIHTIDTVHALVRQALQVSPDKVPSLLAFAGREDYLAWVAAWKALLRATVAEVRQARADRRDPEGTDYSRSDAQMRRQVLRARGRALMALRAAGKDIARAARRPAAEAA